MSRVLPRAGIVSRFEHEKSIYEGPMRIEKDFTLCQD